MEDLLLNKLKDRMQRDMKPVRPLSSGWKRVSVLWAIWLGLALLVLLAFGLRRDHEAVGLWLVWILPLVQIVFAYSILVLSMRLTIPGSAVASSALAGTALLGAAAHLVVSSVIFHLSPAGVEPGHGVHASIVCFGLTLSLSLLPLAAVLYLCSRGFPSRPVILGLACGLGCGLSAEAVWRLHCPFNSWDHVLTSHTAAVAAAALLGWLGSAWYSRRRHNRHE
jgi:hypothetical protein